MLEYFLIAAVVLVLLVIMMSVKIVSQGYRYTIERFGRFVRVGTLVTVPTLVTTLTTLWLVT